MLVALGIASGQRTRIEGMIELAAVIAMPFIVGFISGYGVREMISHGRRKRSRARS